MYLATGAPRVFSARDESLSDALPTLGSRGILGIEPLPGSRLFATFTSHAMYLWSTRPDAMLSKIERSQLTVDEDGQNMALFWKPDGRMIVILTSKGLLHFYDILDDENGTQFKFEFGKVHPTTAGPGEGLGVAKKSLQFKMALEIDCGAQCGIGLDTEMIISTTKPASLLSLSWDGDVDMKATQTFAEMKLDGVKIRGLTHMKQDASSGLVSWITTDGTPWVARRVIGSLPDSDKSCYWKATRIPLQYQSPSLATSIALNDRFSVIAVGTLTGEVFVYSLLATDTLLRTEYSHKMVIAKPGETPAHASSQTSSVAWSSDGYALVAGWEVGGLAVWSTFGHLLFSTFTDESGFLSSPVKETWDDFFLGIKDIMWGPGNYDLFLLPSARYSQDVVSDVYVVQFAKSSVASGIHAGNMKNMLLVTDDKLLVYEGNSHDVDVLNLDPLQWHTIQIPPSYLTLNWPIECASMDITGNYIAVSGRHGFAHYSLLNNKWKLFGNEQQEQSFHVIDIVWCRNYLIVSCFDTMSKQNKLQFYSREMNLDQRSVLNTIVMEAPVICMNNNDSHLHVYTANNMLSYYTLHSDKGNRLVSVLQQQLHLLDVIFNPKHVRAIERKCVDINPEVSKKNPMLILYGDALLYSELDSDGVWDFSPIANKVELFWVTVERQFESPHFLWTSHGSHIRIWPGFESFTSSGLTHDSVDTVELPIDFYPTNVMMYKGILAGVEQQISIRNSMNTSLFRILSKTCLFVHLVLQFYLKRGLIEEALRFANEYKDLSYFGHALEILLHLALENDYVSKEQHRAELACVVRFLENFPLYLDIIVNCARKSEVSLWEFFFSVVGDAKLLFKQCLGAGSLATATSYLIIIQTLEPYSVSGKLALELLSKSLEMENFEIGKELIRFFNSIKEAEAYKSKDYEDDAQLKLQVQQYTDQLDAIVNQHADTLLFNRGEVRTLGRFASSLSFPLGAWLKKVGTVNLKNWSGIFAVIHEQFNWSYPTELDTFKHHARPKRRDSQSRPNTSLQSLTGSPDDVNLTSIAAASPRIRTESDSYRHRKKSQAEIMSEQTLLLREDVEEVIYLQRAFLDGQCWEWGAMFSTMLMDEDQLLALFKDKRVQFEKWKTVVSQVHSRGYDLLILKIEEALKLSVKS